MYPQLGLHPEIAAFGPSTEETGLDQRISGQFGQAELEIAESLAVQEPISYRVQVGVNLEVEGQHFAEHTVQLEEIGFEGRPVE